MSTDEVLKKILGLPVERIRVLFKASQGFERKKISRDLGISVSTYDYHMDKAVEEFEPLIPELYDMEPQESKRDRLLKAIERDVLDLFKPYKINPEDLTEELWERIRLGFEPIPGSEDNQKERKPRPIDPTAEEHPPPSFRELITIQIRRLWDHIPEGLPRILIPGIGLSLIIVIFIWGLTECGGPPPPPQTPEPPAEVTEIPPEEPTEVGQVVPPADTEAPPADTEIPPTTVVPSETSTPTLTTTPTDTPTPTVTPTWVTPNEDNLPLVFEGEYDLTAYAPRVMILNIDTKDGDKVTGTILFPESGRITGWEGVIVHNFDDITERAKWMFIEEFDSEGTYIKETRKWIIAGGGGMDGNYYFYISPAGRLTGVRYRHDLVRPEATIELYFNE